jgi:hypothetical protein
MTFSINGNEVMDILQVVAWVGSIVATLIVGLIVYVMVRPPRHVREQRKRPPMERLDRGETEQLMQLVDRMETRLEVLERALAAETRRHAIGRRDEPRADRLIDDDNIHAPADDDRDSGRIS